MSLLRMSNPIYPDLRFLENVLVICMVSVRVSINVFFLYVSCNLMLVAVNNVFTVCSQVSIRLMIEVRFKELCRVIMYNVHAAVAQFN